VWTGSRAIISGGINIGVGAIIATGAVVTKDVPPYAVVGGVFAKIIKYIFENDIIEKLIYTKWWEFKDSVLVEIAVLIDKAEKFISYFKGSKNEFP
jgi:tetrahydrodipicolinate N-succinyltransferase